MRETVIVLLNHDKDIVGIFDVPPTDEMRRHVYQYYLNIMTDFSLVDDISVEEAKKSTYLCAHVLYREKEKK